MSTADGFRAFRRASVVEVACGGSCRELWFTVEQKEAVTRLPVHGRGCGTRKQPQWYKGNMR